ncbi:MAG: haloalkane dehalogenase [Bradymonadia bacterium]|jgi:haloalkane dehalogenase
MAIRILLLSLFALLAACDPETMQAPQAPQFGASTDPISSDLDLPSKFVDVDGVQLHYVEAGAGKPILLLHGNTASAYLWRNVIPHLEAHGRVIALDLVGMGRSEKPLIDYRLEDHIDFVEGAIDALGLEDVAIAGIGWGAVIGMDYAARHPSNVRALAFMETPMRAANTFDEVPAGVRESMRGYRTPGLGRTLAIDRNLLVEEFPQLMTLRSLSADEMQAYRAPFAEQDGREVLWRFPNELPVAGEPAGSHDVLTRVELMLRTTTLPKLLISAAPGVHVQAAELAWALDNVQALSVVDVGAGLHLLPEDSPHEIGAALSDWLAAR